MVKPRLLITGGSGLLALNWACVMRDTWDVVLGTHSHRVELAGVKARPLDLENFGYLSRQIGEIAPDLIIHTAGLTNVDYCEKHPAMARRVNAELARNVAGVAASRNIRLVHISTDHLFAGKRSNYREDDVPEPLNEYARSKLLAEEWVKQAHPQALIVRTNFFGWGHAERQSFSDWIIYSLRSGMAITLFDDVFFTPILVDALVVAVHRLVDHSAGGTFNLSGEERVSKHEFGMRLAQVFNLSSELIKPGRLNDAHLAARRPMDMSLDNAKVRAKLGFRPNRLEDFFFALRRQEMEGRREELIHAVAG